MSEKPKLVGTLYCSFCGKSQHEVRKLIAGPNVFICDEDVRICMEIVLGCDLEERWHKQGRVLVSAAEAEQVAWMKTWTTAPALSSNTGERDG